MNDSVRDRFEQQIDNFIVELTETARQAFELAMINVTSPHECADVALMAVSWGNGEPVHVGLYVMPNAGAGVSVDGQ